MSNNAPTLPTSVSGTSNALPVDETPTAEVINKRQSDKSDLLMDVTFTSGATGRGKFDLVFQKESNVEIAQRKELARQPYKKGIHLFWSLTM